MSKDFNSVKDLLNHIEGFIDEVLKNEVSEMAVETMKLAITEKVYKQYDYDRTEGRVYKRRGYETASNDGALNNPENFIPAVSDGVLIIRNRATGYDVVNRREVDIVQIIESGRGYSIEETSGKKKYSFPRRFHKLTRSKIKLGKLHVESIISGFLKRGIIIEKSKSKNSK